MDEIERKLKVLDRLMQAMRTEWFVFETTKPEKPSNINQIVNIAQQIINLNLKQQDVE